LSFVIGGLAVALVVALWKTGVERLKKLIG